MNKTRRELLKGISCLALVAAGLAGTKTQVRAKANADAAKENLSLSEPYREKTTSVNLPM